MVEISAKTPKQRVNDRFYALDGLRLFAALLVSGFHYCFVAERDGFIAVTIFPEVTRYMYLGVSLFFILSGFVIPYSSNNKSIKSFVILRVVRLYPAFLFCMPITFIGAYLLFSDPRFSVTLRDAILNITMIPGFFSARMIDGVYWTLLVEIKFYILIGIFLIVKKWVRFEWFLFAWMSVYLINQYVLSLPLSKFIAFPESPLFMIGTLLYMMIAEGVIFYRVIALALALALAYGYESGRATANVMNFGTSFEMKYIFSVIVFFVLLVWTSAKIPVAKWVQKLGDLTYPFYLLHDYLGLILISFLASILSPINSIIFILLLMLVIAYCVNRYVELPVQNFLKKFLSKNTGLSVCAART